MKLKKYGKNWKPLNRDSDFRYIYKKGGSIATPFFICWFKPRKSSQNYVAFVSSKKIGKAVKRNRARRVLREAWRFYEPELKEKFPRGGAVHFNIVFTCREIATDKEKCKMENVLTVMRNRLTPYLTGELQPTKKPFKNALRNNNNKTKK